MSPFSETTRAASDFSEHWIQGDAKCANVGVPFREEETISSENVFGSATLVKGILDDYFRTMLEHFSYIPNCHCPQSVVPFKIILHSEKH